MPGSAAVRRARVEIGRDAEAHAQQLRFNRTWVRRRKSGAPLHGLSLRANSMREIDTGLEGRGLRQRLARLRPRAIGGAWIATGKSVPLAGPWRGLIVLTGWVLVPICHCGCRDHARLGAYAIRPTWRRRRATFARPGAGALSRMLVRKLGPAALRQPQHIVVLHPLRQLLPVSQLRIPAHRPAGPLELPHLRRAAVEGTHLRRVPGRCL